MGKLMFNLLSVLVALGATGQTQINGKEAVGIWKTIDDETGRAKSKVKIYEKNGKYYGRIIELLDPQSLEEAGVERFEDIICDECPKGRGKDEPVLNLLMIWDMEKEDDRWAGGDIMDPKNGKVYGCSLWLDEDDDQGNTLKVRGWLAFFYRTQTWYRVEE